MIFTHFSEVKGMEEYFVYFAGENGRHKAHVLGSNEEFLILIIQTAAKYPPVIFSNGPLGVNLFLQLLQPVVPGTLNIHLSFSVMVL